MTMSEKQFEVKVKVNGTEFVMEDPSPTALEILVLAKQLGAIPNDPEGYVLQGDKGEYQGNQRVNLAEDNVFITIPVSPTQVA
jgi:hypothetical protein